MQSLQHSLLIAMPALNQSFFEKSVIYLCEHNDQGAMGLVINLPIGFNIDTLFQKMQLEDPPSFKPAHQADVLIGGPVMKDRGFVLAHYQRSQLERLTNYCTTFKCDHVS